jgi:hypothetical protein
MTAHRAAILLLLAGYCTFAENEAQILDLKHYSRVFGEERNFRVFLPPDYERAPHKRYPVIYFFHGHSERHNQPPRNRSGYDSGEQYGGDNIARFVGRNDVIVVKWDGYNPRTPGEDYPRPYNVRPETHRQFPFYFPELVRHIDSTFRTIADRDHRATSGLSMGGFMSFWIAGKYPDLVGSASNFMGSSEFYAGPNGFPTEYRHTDMYRNYEGMRTRIVIGSRDFIRWYHRRMNAIWDFTRPHHEHEEFDWDHGTPGMAKTLGFHMEAFRNPLPRPSLWHHSDVYPSFEGFGYSVQTDRRRPGFTTIENVTRSGFRSAVREWLPSGALMPSVAVRVTTDALYRPGRPYWITGVNLSTGEVRQIRQTADQAGCLRVAVDGHLNEIGISDDGSPIVTATGWRVVDDAWATTGKPVRLAIALLNKGASEARDIRATVDSPNPGVNFQQREVSLARLGPGESAEPRQHVVLTVADPDREIVKLVVRLKGLEVPLEIPLFRETKETADFVVADGASVPVWERAITREARTVGTGNADGIAAKGETVAIAIRDGEAIRLAEAFTSHACVDSSRRVSDAWGRYDNVGASAKYSLLLLSATCPDGAEIPIFIRYQLPNKPEHILREGVVRLRVKGRDQTAPHAEWAAVREWNLLETKIHDGGKVRSAFATLRKGDAAVDVRLNDEGRDGDLAAGDRIFSGLVPSPAPGAYSLLLNAEDEFGNVAKTSVEGDFEFQLRSGSGEPSRSPGSPTAVAR